MAITVKVPDPDDPRMVTLCDSGEEAIGILLTGDYVTGSERNLTDNQIRWLAAEHIHREWTYDHADALEQVFTRKVERGIWRWVKAPEGSANDYIIKPCRAVDTGAFEAARVEVG